MKPAGKRPPKEAVILCIELVERQAGSDSSWEVVLSRAGSDSTFSREWINATGQLSPSQAEDLTGWIQTSSYNALVAWRGIQGVLEERLVR